MSGQTIRFLLLFYHFLPSLGLNGRCYADWSYYNLLWMNTIFFCLIERYSGDRAGTKPFFVTFLFLFFLFSLLGWDYKDDGMMDTWSFFFFLFMLYISPREFRVAEEFLSARVSTCVCWSRLVARAQNMRTTGYDGDHSYAIGIGRTWKKEMYPMMYFRRR